MMYLLIIMLSALVSANEIKYELFNTHTKSSYQERSVCPKIDDISIFFVNGILLESEQHAEMKQMLGIQYPVNRTDIESLMTRGAETPHELQKYWRERDVEAVSDLETCLKITSALEDNEKTKQYLNDYRLFYYKISNKYLILYGFYHSGLSERNAPLPQIMDEHFRIIGELDLRESKGN